MKTECGQKFYCGYFDHDAIEDQHDYCCAERGCAHAHNPSYFNCGGCCWECEECDQDQVEEIEHDGICHLRAHDNTLYDAAAYHATEEVVDVGKWIPLTGSVQLYRARESAIEGSAGSSLSASRDSTVADSPYGRALRT